MGHGTLTTGKILRSGFHGNRYLRFLLPSIMDLPGTFSPNQWHILELRKIFHHHSNRCQGNQILVIFLFLGFHGPSSCQPLSRSVQTWGKNNIPHATFRTPGQYIVTCQRGGVSNKPPRLQAATRHGARDPSPTSNT